MMMKYIATKLLGKIGFMKNNFFGINWNLFSIQPLTANMLERVWDIKFLTVKKTISIEII